MVFHSAGGPAVLLIAYVEAFVGRPEVNARVVELFTGSGTHEAGMSIDFHPGSYVVDLSGKLRDDVPFRVVYTQTEPQRARGRVTVAHSEGEVAVDLPPFLFDT
jgi:hypothetical protein